MDIGNVIDIVIIVIHVIVSLAIIVLILLHAGRGGGLSDMFGGGFGPQGGGGSTIAERNLDRLTVIAAVIFSITTMVLTWRLGS
ncbi:MAG: preprotein translocase subunit SecG [Acidimicrobiia bacterium]|nr:preprotein translocase subunit SecG [Acidimicrobiia bacterium]